MRAFIYFGCFQAVPSDRLGPSRSRVLVQDRLRGLRRFPGRERRDRGDYRILRWVPRKPIGRRLRASEISIMSQESYQQLTRLPLNPSSSIENEEFAHRIINH